MFFKILLSNSYYDLTSRILIFEFWIVTNYVTATNQKIDNFSYYNLI